MFEGLGLLGNALILLVSLVVLDKASDWAITNSVKIADITGFGKTTIGFILVAFSTSLPELCVSIFAAIGGESIGVAIGNVLGSNIVNICLILGLAFLIASLKNPKTNLTIKEELETLNFGLFIASIVPLFLIYIGYASRVAGIILIAIFAYNIYRVSKRWAFVSFAGPSGRSGKPGRLIALTIIGVIAVIASAYLIIDSACYIAEWIGIPNVVIGATIVAFGTSLPEFANSLKASLKGHAELALGNIVGSYFINVTLILGVALIGQNFVVNMATYTGLAVHALISSLLLWYFLSSKNINWRGGATLLFLYAVFMAQIFGVYRI